MSKPDDGRYGNWAGNPKGTPEDKRYCVEEVWPTDRAPIPHQCGNKRGFGPGGEWCKAHDPERKRIAKEKDETARAKFDREDRAREATSKALIKRLGAGKAHSTSLRKSPYYMNTGGVVLTREEAEQIAGLIEGIAKIEAKVADVEKAHGIIS